MKLVYALEEPPKTVTKSIFLAGPTPRDPNFPSWRLEAIRILEEMGYNGVVYIPEPRDGKWTKDYTAQADWERCMRIYSDVVLFWVPRDLEKMPAFTTNIEFGEDYKSGKAIYGRPSGAPNTRYLDHIYANAPGFPEPLDSLQGLIEAVLTRLGDGAERCAGEVTLPLHIWKSKQFQEWYKTHKESGNSLLDSEVLFSFWVGPKNNFLFAYVLWVNVWIAAEQREKSNEFVFSRTDISSIVAHRNNEFVLVEEFRSPARNSKSMVLENPGGSSLKKDVNPLQVARDELFEETNIYIQDASRFKMHSSRQLNAVLSSHHSVLFSVELTDEELQQAKEYEKNNEVMGVDKDNSKSSGERCYVRVLTLNDIIKRDDVDWAHLGMILEATNS